MVRSSVKMKQYWAIGSVYGGWGGLDQFPRNYALERASQRIKPPNAQSIRIILLANTETPLY